MEHVRQVTSEWTLLLIGTVQRQWRAAPSRRVCEKAQSDIHIQRRKRMVTLEAGMESRAHIGKEFKFAGKYEVKPSP